MTDVNDPTAPAQPTDDEIIEAAARKWADQALNQHRQTELKERSNARFVAIMAEAGVPVTEHNPSEADQIENIAASHFNRMVNQRRDTLALERARVLFVERYPGETAPF